MLTIMLNLKPTGQIRHVITARKHTIDFKPHSPKGTISPAMRLLPFRYTEWMPNEKVAYRSISSRLQYLHGVINCCIPLRNHGERVRKRDHIGMFISWHRKAQSIRVDYFHVVPSVAPFPVLRH